MKTLRNKKLLPISLLGVIIFIIALINVDFVFAGSITIDGNQIAPFANRTKEDISKQWEIGEIAYYNSIFERGHEQSTSAPYEGGIVRQEVLDDELDNLNFYRWLIGSPKIEKKMEQRKDLQAASVIQWLSLKDGNEMTHTPYTVFKKPADMTQTFYDLGTRASHNIINTADYMGATYCWMQESKFSNFCENGHRRAILDPLTYRVSYGLGATSYGDVDHYYIGDKEIQEIFPKGFAAYPSPGFFPDCKITDWSDWEVYTDSAEFSPLTQLEQEMVTTTIKDVSRNKIYNYSKALGNMDVEQTYIGMKSPEYNYEDKFGNKYFTGRFEVQINNLKDAKGNNVTLKYYIEFYNWDEFQTSPILFFGMDLDMKRIYLEDSSRNRMIEKISVISPNYFNVSLESNMSYQIPINLKKIRYEGMGIKNFNKLYIAEFNYNKNSLPRNILDTENVLGSINLQAYNLTNEKGTNYSIANLNISAKSGESIVITGRVKKFDSTRCHRWFKTDNNCNTIELVNSDKYKIKGNKLIISNLIASDTGKYFVLTQEEDGEKSVSDGTRNTYVSKDIYVSVDNNRPYPNAPGCPILKNVQLYRYKNSCKTIRINWKPVERADGYRVYYRASYSSKWSYIDTRKTTLLKIMDRYGQKYYFKVKSYALANGVKILSDNYSNIMHDSTLERTSLYITKVSKRSYMIFWNDTNGESGYQLYEAKKKNGIYKKVTLSSKFHYVKNISKTGQKYYYKVRPYKLCVTDTGKKVAINGPWSSIKCFE